MYKHRANNIIKQLLKYKNVSIFYQVDVNKLEEYRDELIIKGKIN